MEERQGLKILVAFDGSDLALEAVKYVANLMPAQHTQVVLFHIETKMTNSFWQVEHDMDFRFSGGNIRACIADASSSKRRISVPCGAIWVTVTSCVLARATPMRKFLRSGAPLIAAFLLPYRTMVAAE